MIRIALTVVLLLSPGIAAAGDDPPAAPQPTEGRLLAVRGVSGGEAQLTDRKGDRRLLTGSWKPELLRLDGHLVSVWGAPGKERLKTPTIVVSRYEILDSGGGKPRVGHLTDAGDGLTLTPQAGGAPIRLTGSRSMVRKLRKRLGCKVWVVARWPKEAKAKGKEKGKGKAVRARVYGWLSCPPADKKSSTGTTGAKAPAAGKSK